MRVRHIGSALVAVVVVLTMAVAPVLAQDQQLTRAQQLAEEGRKLVEEGKFQQALEKLEQAVEADATWQFAHYFKGFAHGNLQQHELALESFQRALELAPEWPDAARMSAIAAFQTGQVDLAWDYAVRAHQGGADISQLRQMMADTDQPDDLEARLNAPRVFVDQIDVEGLLARNENPFGRAVDTGDGATGDVTQQQGSTVQSRSTTTSRATNTGNRLLAESQADLNTLLRKTRESLGASPSFGLVPRREMSNYVMVYEIDDMGEGSRRNVEGYIRLFDARTGEEVYKRVLELRDISSVGDLNADIERYVDYLEEWMAEQNR